MNEFDVELDSYIISPTLASTNQRKKLTNTETYDLEKCTSYDILPIGLAHHPSQIYSICATSNFKWIFTGSEDGFIRKYDLVSFYNGDASLTIHQKNGLPDTIIKSGILISAWENDGISTKDSDSKISPVFSMDVHSEAVWCLTGLENGSINLWTVRQDEGKCVYTFRGHSSVVSCLKICPNEKSFLSGSWDKSIKRWNLDDGSIIQEYEILKSQVTCINFKPLLKKNEFVFLAATFDGTIYIFDDKTCMKSVSPVKGSTTPWCLSAQWSFDGNSIFCGRKNESVDEIDVKLGVVKQTIKMPSESGWVSFVAVMPNDRQLLCCSNDNIRLWDLQWKSHIEDANESRSDSLKKSHSSSSSLDKAVPFTVISGHHGGMISSVIFDSCLGIMLSVSGTRGWKGMTSNNYCLLGILEMLANEGIRSISILGTESIYLGCSITEFITADIFKTTSCSSIVVVSDHNVAKWHLDTFMNSLIQANETPQKKLLQYLIAPGELSKSRETKAQIEDWLLSNKCTRDTAIIALGGGVVGDLTGFIASTFMRGVTFIQIPTTLLAMVDSSIGGKTAIDTPHGKNLIGSFYQPIRIYIDISYLKTLPKREFVNGMAEIIKTAAIRSEEDFYLLENYPDRIISMFSNLQDEQDKELLIKIIMGSAQTKADIVTLDEKEGGLRGLLNFGHTIGHAIEAILSPELLHGECVAIGMIKEAEIARHMGFLNDVSVGRLFRCIQSYGLPTSLDHKLVKSLAPHKHCKVDDLLDFMCVDKKNQGSSKKIVMLSCIGKTVEPRASFVLDPIIRKILCSAIAIIPPSLSFQSRGGFIKVPGSKSISNRALIMAALGHGTCQLHGLLHSDDVQVMLDALQKLVGITFEWENEGSTLVITGGGGRLHSPDSEIYLGNAGTASRFLTTVCALISSDPKNTILTGNQRMKQRPIGPLVDALRENGCSIRYLESEGSLPIEISSSGTGLLGGNINLSASISSQYVSSILIAAPYAVNPVILDLSGDSVISQPYIDMTISMMESFGIQVKKTSGKNQFEIPLGVYQNPSEYFIEADASSATYPLAFAAITGSTVTVTNIGSKSLQGDSEFAIKVLAEMGCEVEQTETSTTVTGPAILKPIPNIDMETMTDAFLTASVLAAVASGVTKITGIANQRVKECNRIAVMVEQLSKFGVTAKELPDGIEIHGIDKYLLNCPEGGLECYDDHRIAMSFSVLCCAFPRDHGYPVINEKKCVEKTWPSWWDTLENILHVSLTGVDLEHDSAIQQPNITNAFTYPENSSLVLIGMRGAGKTQLGKYISHSLKREFIDMDKYLEKKLSKTISKIIEDEGWESFRMHETIALKDVLNEHPVHTVISCGGGIVESPESRELLSKWRDCHGHILYLNRNIADIIPYLNEDKTRPSYGEDVQAVWNRRKHWYKECRTLEFNLPLKTSFKNDTEYWTRIELALLSQLKFCLFPSPVRHDIGFFVCLTYNDLNDAISDIDTICDGADAVEFRVDLLSSFDPDYVSNQYALLKCMTKLPVVFTVRSETQGGKFKDDEAEKMMDFLESAFAWGCEYVDIQITTLVLAHKNRLEMILSRKGHSKVIGSFHDLNNEMAWTDCDNSHTCKTKQMRDMYTLLHPWADIIKLIGKAHTMSDNFKLSRFLENVVPSLGLVFKPLIALNMGELGKLSRILNSYMTPVTHSLLPSSAAPGQLCISEIHEMRHKLGILNKKKFYLFGKPISQSMSPTLHNSGFSMLGLPFEYELFETSDVEQMKEFIQAQIGKGVFGGASITIPLKEAVIKSGIVSIKTESAKIIGAVNTLCIDSNGNSIIGDNTDWIGIKSVIEKKSTNKFGKRVGIVLGAGGTARAACFALLRLERVSEIRIWNRSIEKAQKLNEDFGVLPTEFKDLLSSEEPVEFIIVSTIPSEGQDHLDFSVMFSSESSGVVLDMAYRPIETKLLRFAKSQEKWKCVPGIEVLLEQGFEQFELWTARKAPKSFIRTKVFAEYQKL